MATTRRQQRLPQRDRGRGAGGVPLLRQLRTPGSFRKQCTRCSRESPAVMPVATMRHHTGSVRRLQRGTRGDTSGVNHQVVDQVWLAGAVIIRTASFRRPPEREQSASRRIVANESA